ncbi:MAG TPA: acryloyl-CoA reductase [Acidimicrobiales bacterium]|jgi:acrylyl-CoA reductase (NADPH)|nr:acryloyl-CoA reductase [Acidimicrobiales bacterium]
MTFPAFLVARDAEPAVTELDDSALPAGDVLVDVAWSAVNYKDAMVTVPGNRVARISPLVPGVDLAGTVAASDDPALAPGTPVLVHGYDLGVARHGGFAARARVPAGWVVPLPAGLDGRRAMVVGTAGFTALLSLHRLRQVGLVPADGPVLVTGASGGVGSTTVALLARHGYEVVASTGKAGEHDYLRRLGATRVVDRDALHVAEGRVLGPEQWAGAVDCVGGTTLAAVLRTVRYGGAVAASGLTAGSELATTVYPFIVRGVALLGVDTVATPIELRRSLWATVAEQFPADLLEEMVSREIGLDDLAAALPDVLAGRVRGRLLVRPAA